MMSDTATPTAEAAPAASDTPTDSGKAPEIRPLTNDPPASEAGPSSGSSEPAGEAGSQPAGEPTNEPDPKAGIAELAESIGLPADSLSGFSDLASAKAAARLVLESTAREGLKGGLPRSEPRAAQPATSAPTTPAQPADPPAAIDLAALGLDEKDPAAKVIQALEKRLGETSQQTSAIEQRFAQMEQQQRAAARQQYESEAASIVDGFASPTYGTAQNRTSSQQLAVMQLYDLADALMIGAHNAGRPIPPLQQRLAQARMLHESGSSPATPVAPATPAAPPAKSPPPAGAAPEMKMTDRWSENPELLRQLGLR